MLVVPVDRLTSLSKEVCMVSRGSSEVLGLSRNPQALSLSRKHSINNVCWSIMACLGRSNLIGYSVDAEGKVEQSVPALQSLPPLFTLSVDIAVFLS